MSIFDTPAQPSPYSGPGNGMTNAGFIASLMQAMRQAQGHYTTQQLDQRAYDQHIRDITPPPGYFGGPTYQDVQMRPATPAAAAAPAAPSFDPATTAANSFSSDIRWPQASTPAPAPVTPPNMGPAPAAINFGFGTEANPNNPASTMDFAVAAKHGYDLGRAHEQVIREAAMNAFSSPQFLDRVQTYIRSGLGQGAAEAMARRDIAAATPGISALYHDTYEPGDITQQQSALDTLAGIAQATHNTTPYNTAANEGLANVQTGAPTSIVATPDGGMTLFRHDGSATPTNATTFPGLFSPSGPQAMKDAQMSAVPGLLRLKAETQSAIMRNPEFARAVMGMDVAKSPQERQAAIQNVLLKAADPKLGMPADALAQIQQLLMASIFHPDAFTTPSTGQ